MAMKKYPNETIVGILVVVGLVCIAYMTVKLGNITVLGSDAYPLYAKFDSASGLRAGSNIDMFGVEIGKVEQLSLDQADGQAVVELSIRKGIRIYGDAIASIKTEGLIGDRYVSIDPGGSEKQLSPGATIIETQSPVDLSDLIGKYVFGGVKDGSNSRSKGPSGK